MSGLRRWLAALVGTFLLALTVPVDAGDPPGSAIGIVAGAGVQAAEQAPAIPTEVVPPGQSPPDESFQVRVVSEGEVPEGSPLKFQVHLPDRLDPTGLKLTYSVFPGGGNAREGADYREPGGPVLFTRGSSFGTFEIPTMFNPASGGATLLVVVTADNQVAGRAIGNVVDRPPPSVEVTSSPVVEGEELVFEFAIDPADEFRGPWTYAWRIEGVDAVEGAFPVGEEDYQPLEGTLRFDADGQPQDEVRIRTRQNDASAEPRTLRLIVSADGIDYGSGLGVIEDRLVATPGGTNGNEIAQPPPPPSPAPDWDWTLVAIGLAVLVVLTMGAWRMLRPTPSPVLTEGMEQDISQEPVTPELVIATSSGPRMFEPTEFGLPELAIETKAGPAVFTPPARLPVEPVGG